MEAAACKLELLHLSIPLYFNILNGAYYFIRSREQFFNFFLQVMVQSSKVILFRITLQILYRLLTGSVASRLLSAHCQV
jgi:hypothetical protein